MIKNRTRNFLRAVATSVLLFPLISFAAYNDVTLTSDALLNVSGGDINVSGSSAVVESIAVSDTTFSVTLLPNSAITLVSSGRKVMTPSVPFSSYVRYTCSPSSYTLVLEADPSVETVTISVSVSSSECSSTYTNQGGGGGGGGGGIISTTSVTPATTATVVPATQTTQTTPAASETTASTGYSRGLSLGSSGNDVAALKTLLESKGFLVMPSGIDKGYFGSLTKKALAEYQASVGIDPIGIVGPATRAHLNSL